MAPVERIRYSSILIFIVLFFVGCMQPERAGQDRMALRDRSGLAGDRIPFQVAGASSSSRPQSSDVIRAAGDDAWSPAKSSSIAQVSAREQTPGNPSPSANIFPSTHPPLSTPTAPPLTPMASVPTANASSPSPASGPESTMKVRELYNQAALRFATIDSYVARLRRREQVKGKDQPEELILFKFRKQPWSVYFKWLGHEGQGREVVYVKGQHGDMIHSLLAAGDMPLAPAGKHMALSPDNIFVRSASRHAITEAGIGVIIEKLGQGLEAQERGNRQIGTLAYRGLIKRPEFEAALETLEHTLPPGLESQMPRGGRRWIFFDPVSHLPVLLITHDDKDHEVEYYCYDRLQYPVKLDDLDFDPEKLWPGKK